MSKQTEALKLALEGLEKWHFDKDPRGADEYITAIREALADSALDRMAENARELGIQMQPEQKPIARLQWADGWTVTLLTGAEDIPSRSGPYALYVGPAPEQPAKEKAPQSANCEAPGWINSDHSRKDDCTTKQPYPDNFIDALKYDVAKRDSEAQQAYEDAFVNGTGVMLGDKRIDPASIYKQPEPDNTYNYAKNLAEAIFKQHFAGDEHYASGRIVWGVNDTVIGILTQIDNMVADMVRRPAQQQESNK